ncbi:MAG: AMP-binding protein, partial [Hyphomicrobiales bacterium]
MGEHVSGVRFAPVGVNRSETADGGFVLRADAPLEDYPETLCHHVERQAAAVPERDFLAERAGDGAWRRITYGVFRDKARAVAAGLLARGITAGSPVMILSDNGIDNALMQFGAIYAGIPAAPVSPAYSLMSQDHAKLRFIFDLLKPKVVFA